MWEEKKDKIKLFLRNTLIPTKTIYARECTIEKLDNKEVREFVNRYHLQGSRNAQITYGLFHDNTLVQIMSFSKSKYNKNLKEENSYEIIRECSSCRIVGGISKLFRHFINDYNPSLVFSYCDFNKFNGIGYEKMGMKFIGYTSPDLKYCIHGQIINRNPKKYKVIRGQMDYSIYGAGNKKYLWKKAAIDN